MGGNTRHVNGSNTDVLYFIKKIYIYHKVLNTPNHRINHVLFRKSADGVAMEEVVTMQKNKDM